MKLKTSILFWSAAVCAVFLGATEILRLNGLQFRIWVREPVSLLIAFGLAAGLLQLLLRIGTKWLKTAAIVLWALAFVGGVCYGGFIFALSHRYEESQDAVYEGKRCIVENYPALWESHELYFEYHNWFVCGNQRLYEE